ncbi:MAG: hypothetical protein LC713_07230, partial [Actinobacteria bacterium]|nr:hypothetical protein [Actinomycetota bacterium]
MAFALAAPEVEYVNPPEAVDPGVRRGATEFGQALRNLAESFDSSRNELRELFDAGEVVVASVSFCTRSRGSATEVVQEEAHRSPSKPKRWSLPADAPPLAARRRERLVEARET